MTKSLKTLELLPSSLLALLLWEKPEVMWNLKGAYAGPWRFP